MSQAEHEWPKTDPFVLYASEFNEDIVPLGSIIAFHKDMTGVGALPHTFVECNGQTIDDEDSPFNGSTLPDMNGAVDSDKRFVRGAESSGDESGSTTASISAHAHTVGTSNTYSNLGTRTPTIRGYLGGGQTGSSSGSVGIVPKYFDIVWCIKIK